MSLSAALQARKAQLQGQDPNRPWLQDGRDKTLEVVVPNEHLDKQVSSIVIHSSSVVLGDGTQAAHFRIFLQLPEKCSVEVNSYGLTQVSHETKLRIAYCGYQYSTSQKTFMDASTVPIHNPFTVRDAVLTLVNNNRDRYRLDAGTGIGCRYWCSVVITDFINNGWVAADKAGCVDELAQSLANPEGPFKHFKIPIPAPTGIFY